MDSLLQQFKSLSAEIRNKVSSEQKVKALEEIEAKYSLLLAKTVVRVIIKDIAWHDLENFLVKTFNLSAEKASQLKKDLAGKIFNEVKDYLTEKPIEQSSVKEEPEKTRTWTLPFAETEPEVEKEITETDKDKEEMDFNKISKEAKDILSKIKSADSSAVLTPEKIIKEIKEKLNFVFEDEVLERRFENIIRSYFKEVRDEVQVEEMLKKSKKIGGLEISSEQAILITQIIKEYKKKQTEIYPLKTNETAIAEVKKTATAEIQKKDEIQKRPATTATAEAQNKDEAQKPAEPQSLQKEYNEETRKKFQGGAILPTFPKIEKPLEIQKKPAATLLKTDQTDKSPTKTKKPETGSISIKIKEPISDEKLVKDVDQGRLRAVGPIEELAEMTLIDLQRWGGGKKTSQIIFDKINLLGELSLLKKAEGIKAWQRSPLFKLYLEIGQQALEQKKSVNQIIQQREKNNQPVLKLEDFEAINELGRKLKF